MDAMKVKIVKVVKNEWNDKNIIFYEGNRIRESVTFKINMYGENDFVKKIKEFTETSVILELSVGDKAFMREYDSKGNSILLKFNLQHYEVLEVKKIGERFEEVKVKVVKQDYEIPLAKLVSKYEKEFYFFEKELLNNAYDLIKKDYKWDKFQVHREIGGRIIDGIAWVGDNRENAQIIGFEVKTNKDNYSRLYAQLDAYLNICDKVYLIIEDKEVPKDLPFYVGIIKIEGEKPNVIRQATCLKHSISHNEFWYSMARITKSHCEVRGKDDLFKFFEMVESIKRKMLWNQYCGGFAGYEDDDYIGFTPDEKGFVQEFYKSKDYQKILKKYDILNKHKGIKCQLKIL